MLLVTSLGWLAFSEQSLHFLRTLQRAWAVRDSLYWRHTTFRIDFGGTGHDDQIIFLG